MQARGSVSEKDGGSVEGYPETYSSRGSTAGSRAGRRGQAGRSGSILDPTDLASPLLVLSRDLAGPLGDGSLGNTVHGGLSGLTVGNDGLVVASVEFAVRGSGRDHRDPDEGGQGERKDSGGTHIGLMCWKRDIRSGLWRRGRICVWWK